jgi:1-acyl-sn-glycerol-3-phosphate acyltransferase
MRGVINSIARILIRLLIELRVEVTENVPRIGPALLLVSHTNPWIPSCPAASSPGW